MFIRLNKIFRVEVREEFTRPRDLVKWCNQFYILYMKILHITFEAEHYYRGVLKEK